MPHASEIAGSGSEASILSTIRDFFTDVLDIILASIKRITTILQATQQTFELKRSSLTWLTVRNESFMSDGLQAAQCFFAFQNTRALKTYM